MIIRFFHWAASHGWVYDRIQSAAGATRVHSELASCIPAGRLDYVLDIGGGTGDVRKFWPSDSRYICLDIEQPKLEAFLRKVPDGIALLADATHIPIASGSVDALVCTKVAHHLPEDVLENALRECRRILKSGGYFVFMDALKRPDRLASKIMWRLDRGAFPYHPEQLIDILGRHFEIVEQKRFSTLHDFLILVLRKSALSEHE